MDVGQVLWQLSGNWTLYTVPELKTAKITEFFVTNRWSTVTEYTIYVVRNWDAQGNHNMLVKSCQIVPLYYPDRVTWLEMTLSAWDSIICSTTWDCTFQIFWYEWTTMWASSNDPLNQLLQLVNA